jgi:hypothetical protein
MQHQRRSLIARIVGAVTEKDPRAPQACRAARDEPTDRECAALALCAALAPRAAASLRAACSAPGSRTCMK